MRKTLLITSDFPPTKGGIQTYLSNICKKLPPDKIIVIAPKVPEAELYDKRVKYKIYRLRYPENKSFVEKTLFLFQIFFTSVTNGVQVIYCGHAVSVGFFSLLLAKLFGKPLIIFTHALEILKNEDSKLVRLVLANSTYLITVGSFMKQKLKKMGYDEKKIITVSPTVDVKRFSPQKKDQKLVRKYGLEGKKVLLSVGRMVKRKGYQQVITALPAIKEKVPNVVYLIVGEGEYLQELHELVKKLNISDQVRFVSAVKDFDLPKFYNLCDVFIQPDLDLKGDVEGFGIVFIEASACSKLVIGGMYGGAVDAIKNQYSGYLVDSKDINQIVDYSTKFLNNPDFARSVGKKGRNWVVSEFNYEKQIKKLQELTF